jgi:hypothetical protein
MIRIVLAATAVMAATAAPAHAGVLGSSFADSGTCYARHYDEAHMAGHPRQRVHAIYLSHTAEPDPAHKGVLLEFGFVTRDGEHYSANAYCDKRDRCSLEGDGGTFHISETGDGLRIDVGDFLGLEGRNGWSGDLTESDDRVFLIFPDAPRACSLD